MARFAVQVLVAVLGCTLAAPASASPFAHAFKSMSQGPAPAPTAPAPVAPGPIVARPYEGPVVQPYPLQYAGPPPAPTPPNRSLMISGWALLGASYAVTALVGAGIADGRQRCHDPARCERVGYSLLIPLAGPFMAIEPAEHDLAEIFLGFGGVIQVAALIQAIAGTALFIGQSNRRRTASAGRLEPASGVGLRYRF